MRSIRVVSDSHLLGAAVGGDRAALDALCTLHYQAVLRFCRRLTRDHHTAEDLTQATFTRAVQKFASFDPSRPLMPWLQAIARNICADTFRAQASRPQETVLDAEMSALIALPSDLDSDVVRRVVLDDVLGSMNPRYRRVIELRGGEGYSYRELATELKATLPAVNKLVGRAAAQLRERLEVVDRVVALIFLIRLRARSAAMKVRMQAAGFLDSAGAQFGLAGIGAVAVVGGIALTLAGDASGPSERTEARIPAMRATAVHLSPAARLEPTSGREDAGSTRRRVQAGPASITTGGGNDRTDPTGGHLRVDVMGPDGQRVFWHEDAHRCDRGQVTPEGSLVHVRC